MDKELFKTHPDRLLSVNSERKVRNSKQWVINVIEEALSKGYTIIPSDGGRDVDNRLMQGIVLFKDVDGEELAYNPRWEFGALKVCTSDLLKSCGVVVPEPKVEISNKIYMVTGETGEFEDFKIWNVKAFLNKQRAEEFVLTCNNFLIDKKILTKNQYIDEEVDESQLDASPDKFLKDNFACSGVEYKVEENDFDGMS